MTASQLESPTGYSVRAPTQDDFAALLDLILAADIADVGKHDYDESNLRDDWKQIDLTRDACLMVATDGAFAGYGESSAPRSTVHLNGHVVVAPLHRGLGIGTFLTRWTEQRARERVADAPPGARVSIGYGTPLANAAAVELLTDHGYEIERYFLRMAIELDAPPPEPVTPQDVTIRTFITGVDDHATHRAVDDSFADHWNHVSESFEQWRSHAVEHANLDPTLYFLAVEGDEVAGVSLCANYPDLGFVNTVGVRRQWRRTGIGIALLHHSFGEFYRRGQKRVALSVDAQSLTGATRLYERAGMHEQRRYATFAKELRPGIELGIRAAT